MNSTIFRGPRSARARRLLAILAPLYFLVPAVSTAVTATTEPPAVATNTALAASPAVASATIPVPQQLLPDDTLVMITVPDFAKLKAVYRASPQGAFWSDDAMKPFKDRFLAKWREELVDPLERELDIKLDSYTALPQGQITFAVTRTGGPSDKGQESPGLLLLLDARDRSDLLRTNLADLQKKWVASGKTMRTEKIRGFEFAVLPVSSNDVPATLKKLFPPTAHLQEAPVTGDESKEPAAKNEWVIGQVNSLLILGNSDKVIEKVVARLSGGSVPSLAEQAAFGAGEQALFHDAPFYGWVNVKAFIDEMTRRMATKKAAPDDPLVPFNGDKVIAATGLAGLKSVAFATQSTPDGSMFQLFVGVPESSRQGIFKILAGEAKESGPPPFVPADAVKFQRWRIDGQKAWASLEKMLADISPQSASGLNFLLDTANAAAREKDPGFDVRKNLIGNLGDDIISYEKAARPGPGGTFTPLPSLYLIGSPNAEQLSASLKSVLIIINPQAGAPTEREFLGRKIYSVPLPALPVGMPDTVSRPAQPRTLEYAASGGYVAMSSDAATLEEYLRSSDSQAKSLREADGFVAAMGNVVGPGTSLFGYANQSQTMRATFDAAAKDPAAVESAILNPIANSMGMAGQTVDVKDMMDFSLLPPFDKVAKYFSFMVYSGSADVNGLTLKVFSPVPPGMKAAAAAKP